MSDQTAIGETDEVAHLLFEKQRIPVEGAITVGRAPECDLVLESERVSRRHAEIAFENGRWRVEDLDSLNGTKVNGTKLKGQTAIVGTGDVVEVGPHHMILVGPRDSPGATRPGASVIGVSPVVRRLLIGRDQECDIVIASDLVSRRHAEIVWTPDGPEIRDLDSRNGTRVNGEPITSQLLEAGDEIGIASFRVTFDGEQLVSSGEPEPLSLAAEGVSLEVDGNRILDDVTVSFEPGTLTAIVGPSGAGKSTLMRVLSGELDPTSGAVTVNGDLVGTRRAEIGAVPQEDIFHPELTVNECLLDAARLRLPADTGEQELAEAVDETIAELELEHRKDLRSARLSGGQRKRLNMGVELVSGPGVLLLDEPTTGLDPGLEARMMELFCGLAEPGRSVVVVTHATRSLELCNEVVIMGEGGELCFAGPPDEALEFFEVDHYDEIYEALAGETDWAARFRDQGPSEAPEVVSTGIIRRQSRTRPSELARDFGVYLRRQAKITVRDRRNLLLVTIQAPILALVIVLLFRGDVFSLSSEPGPEVQLLFTTVITALWLGAIGASREFVREKAIFARERATGVSIFPYLGAKIGFQWLICVAQVLVMLAIILIAKPLHERPSSYLEFLAVFLVLALAAATLGLMISALASSENQATSIIPLVLIPQLLLGGAIIPVERMSSVMELISRLAASQWGLRGAGSATSIQVHIDRFPTYASQADFGKAFFGVSVSTSILALVLISAAQVAVTGVALRRGR